MDPIHGSDPWIRPRDPRRFEAPAEYAPFGTQTGKVGSDRGKPEAKQLKINSRDQKLMFNTCSYPYGVHSIKVLALGPILAILIFQGSQMTLMTTKMAMFFRHEDHQHTLMTPLNHCNNERPQISASVPPINTS